MGGGGSDLDWQAHLEEVLHFKTNTENPERKRKPFAFGGWWLSACEGNRSGLGSRQEEAFGSMLKQVS